MVWLSSDKLNELSQNILNNFTSIAQNLDLNLNERSDCFCGCCPIHEGSDNPNAFVMYKNTGVWMCLTHGCHKIFRQTPIGFIRGVLSSNNGWKNYTDANKICSFDETVAKIHQIIGGQAICKNKTRSIIKTPSEVYEEQSHSIDAFRQQICCPSKYYMQRGFDETILRKFLVGENLRHDTPMKNRVLVPIFDENLQHIVGCTARTLFDKCIVCGGFHPNKETCPDPKMEPKAYQKWSHNKGFKKTRYLYNFWNVKNTYEKYNKDIILVEGPSEVWKLEEAGILNSMAIFGSGITGHQIDLVSRLTPSRIITIMDSDEGGLHAEESCLEAFKNRYKIECIMPSKNDLGDMSKQEIFELFRTL